jgi:hypothetical protein
MKTHANRHPEALVHFLCGGVVGSICGFCVWGNWLDGGDWGWLAVPAMTLIIACLAVELRDAFWERWILWLSWWV